VIILFVQCFFNSHFLSSTLSAHCTKWYSKQFSCRRRCGKQSHVVLPDPLTKS